VLPSHSTHDLLILRNGTLVRGTIPVCEVDTCRLGSKSYGRDEIAWIGLAQSSEKPPRVSGVAEDEVHLLDDSVHLGHLEGISLGEVAIEGGAWDREDVGWIHLAGAPSAPSSIGGDEEKEPPGGGGDGKNTPEDTADRGGNPPNGGSDTYTPPDNASGDHPTPPPPPPPGTGRPGGMWSGEIHIHFKVTGDDTSTDQKTDIAAHLREYRSSLLKPTDGKPYGTLVRLTPEGTVIHAKYVSDATGEYAGSHCDGEGTATKTETPGAGASVIYISNVASDTTPWIGFPITRGTPDYSVSLGIPPEKYDVNCVAWRMSGGRREEFPSTAQEAFYVAGFGRSPLGCPPFLKNICDPQIRTIVGENGRMFGAFHNTWKVLDLRNDLTVRWSLCRDDVACAPAPPEPEDKPCGGTEAEQGKLDVCNDAANAIVGEMKTKWDASNRYKDKASPHQADFMKALGACVGWDAAELAIEALLITEAPSIGLSEEAAAEVKEFKESLELVNQLMSAAMNGNALEAFKPGNVDELMTALEAVKNFFETFPVLDHGEPEKFLEHLDECNAPLSPELKSSAQSFLFDMQHSFEELNDYRKLSNDLRSKENECLNQQQKLYDACLQDAECKGTPASACDAMKPRQ
jgi:hypothetical protein